MKMVHEESHRKGPWTEQEDLQLVYFVRLFGERRWDILAKVSGSGVAGKHSNRWSKIAQKLPGRTDNEIKNYWRTHMRKKAQERKRASSALSSSSFSSTSLNNPPKGSSPNGKIEEGSLRDKGSCSNLVVRGEGSEEEAAHGFSMDQIWEEIASSEEVNSLQVYEQCKGEGCNFSCPPMDSPLWDCSDALWRIDEEENKMLLPMGSGSELFVSNSFCFNLLS